MTTGTRWPQEILDKAAALAAEGFSASRIAELCSTPERAMTRNAVIGLGHRGHLKLKGKPEHEGRNLRQRAARVKAPTVKLAAAPVPRAPKEEPAPLGRPGEYRDGCKWLHGDSLSGEWVQCGHARADGSPYCPHHHARARTAARTFRRENPHSHSASRETERALLKVMR